MLPSLSLNQAALPMLAHVGDAVVPLDARHVVGLERDALGLQVRASATTSSTWNWAMVWPAWPAYSVW